MIAHRIGDAFAAVAYVDGPNAAGDSIEVLFAGLIPNSHALTFNDDIRVYRLKHFVLDKVMPNVGFVVGDNFSQVILQIAVHKTCSFGIGGC